MLPWTLYPLFAALLIYASGMGVVLGYHRVLTHRAARLHPLVERALILLGAPAGTPVQWIGNHRFHHQVADTPADPHAPALKGFWTAHAGWYLETDKTLPALLYTFAGPLRMLFDAFWRPRTGQAHAHLAPELLEDRFYAWLSRPFGYALVMLSYLAAIYAAAFVLFGPWALLVTAGVHVFVYAMGDLVNSIGHDTAARDVWWLGVIALGDGFHGVHHRVPSSIRCGFGWTRPDGAYLFARVLEKLGLAERLILPSARALARHHRPLEEAHVRPG